MNYKWKALTYRSPAGWLQERPKTNDSKDLRQPQLSHVPGKSAKDDNFVASWNCGNTRTVCSVFRLLGIYSNNVKVYYMHTDVIAAFI